LCQVLESTRNHQSCILKVEALRHRAWEVERLSHDHLTGLAREVEGDVVPKHMLTIIRPLRRYPGNGTDKAVASVLSTNRDALAAAVEAAGAFE
jgi:hypothetical protein